VIMEKFPDHEALREDWESVELDYVRDMER
jgi:hypothetical protein